MAGRQGQDCGSRLGALDTPCSGACRGWFRLHRCWPQRGETRRCRRIGGRRQGSGDSDGHRDVAGTNRGQTTPHSFPNLSQGPQAPPTNPRKTATSGHRQQSHSLTEGLARISMKALANGLPPPSPSSSVSCPDLAPWKTSTSASAGVTTANASEVIAVAAVATMNATTLALALNILLSFRENEANARRSPGAGRSYRRDCDPTKKRPRRNSGVARMGRAPSSRLNARSVSVPGWHDCHATTDPRRLPHAGSGQRRLQPVRHAAG